MSKFGASNRKTLLFIGIVPSLHKRVFAFCIYSMFFSFAILWQSSSIQFFFIGLLLIDTYFVVCCGINAIKEFIA